MQTSNWDSCYWGFFPPQVKFLDKYISKIGIILLWQVTVILLLFSACDPTCLFLQFHFYCFAHSVVHLCYSKEGGYVTGNLCRLCLQRPMFPKFLGKYLPSDITGVLIFNGNVSSHINWFNAAGKRKCSRKKIKKGNCLLGLEAGNYQVVLLWVLKAVWPGPLTTWSSRMFSMLVGVSVF